MTNKDAVLATLKVKPLTTFEAFAELGVTRLAAYISMLKRDGYRIGTRTIDRVNRYGKIIHFAEYRLLEEDKQ